MMPVGDGSAADWSTPAFFKLVCATSEVIWVLPYVLIDILRDYTKISKQYLYMEILDVQGRNTFWGYFFVVPFVVVRTLDKSC